MTDHTLTLARADFAELLRFATQGVSSTKPHFSVRLEFQADELRVVGPGAEVSAPATGTWPAAVLIDGHAAKALASRLPQLDPFSLTATENQLVIGRFALAATVMAVAPAAVEIVLGSSHREVLVAVQRHGFPAVVGSLGKEAVDDAESAVQGAIAAATQALSGFGVHAAEVAEAVRTALRRQARQGGAAGA